MISPRLSTRLLMRAVYGEHFCPNVIYTESASREILGK